MYKTMKQKHVRSSILKNTPIRLSDSSCFAYRVYPGYVVIRVWHGFSGFLLSYHAYMKRPRCLLLFSNLQHHTSLPSIRIPIPFPNETDHFAFRPTLKKSAIELFLCKVCAASLFPPLCENKACRKAQSRKRMY